MSNASFIFVRSAILTFSLTLLIASTNAMGDDDDDIEVVTVTGERHVYENPGRLDRNIGRNVDREGDRDRDISPAMLRRHARCRDAAEIENDLCRADYLNKQIENNKDCALLGSIPSVNLGAVSLGRDHEQRCREDAELVAEVDKTNCRIRQTQRAARCREIINPVERER